MEVNVLSAENFPKNPVIAVRAGTFAAQTELNLNTPFHVLAHGSKGGCIEVKLYQQLGTQTIPETSDAESTVDVPVTTLDGASSQVKLRIARKPAGSTSADSQDSSGSVDA